MTAEQASAPFQSIQARGWVVVVLILLGGAVATAINLWYQRSLALRSVDYWGREPTMRIADAPHVDLLQLLPDQTIDATVPLRTDFEANITGAPGLENVRRALLLDPDFSEPLVEAIQPRWQYGLRFIDGEQSTTVLVSFDPPALRSLEQPRAVGLSVLEQGMREFIEGRFRYEAQLREPPSDPELLETPQPAASESPTASEAAGHDDSLDQ